MLLILFAVSDVLVSLSDYTVIVFVVIYSMSAATDYSLFLLFAFLDFLLLLLFYCKGIFTVFTYIAYTVVIVVIYLFIYLFIHLFVFSWSLQLYLSSPLLRRLQLVAFT